MGVLAGEGVRSGAVAATLPGLVNVTSAFVFGFTIFIAEDFLGIIKVGPGLSALGAGEGVVGGCVVC
jgi:hypothetical protein